jgi:hypothetical protein
MCWTSLYANIRLLFYPLSIISDKLASNNTTTKIQDYKSRKRLLIYIKMIGLLRQTIIAVGFNVQSSFYVKCNTLAH